MREKGVAFANRPVVAALPRAREPIDGLASYAAAQFKTAQ
jgi:hypothetical protein